MQVNRVFSVQCKSLPVSSGVFMTDISTADVESAAEGDSVEVFAIRSDFLFLELTGVLKISAIPEIQNNR